jgi:hypothetical protein
MVPKTFQFHLENDQGTLITFPEIGTPWSLAVSVPAGPGGLGSNGANVCSFTSDGYCDINFSLDTAGTGYSLTFTVYNSDGNEVTTVDPVNIPDVLVAARPLGIVYTVTPIVVPKGVVFSLTISIWDEALGEKADPTSVTIANDLICTLNLEERDGNDPDGVLIGTTVMAIDPTSKISRTMFNYIF